MYVLADLIGDGIYKLNDLLLCTWMIQILRRHRHPSYPT